MAVETAFCRCWKVWSQTSFFPRIKATVSQNDLTSIFRKSAGRRGVFVNWKNDHEYRPELVDCGLTVQEVAEILEQTYGVSLDEWVSLSGRFIAELGQSHAGTVKSPLIRV
jgi:hypothetical protein